MLVEDIGEVSPLRDSLGGASLTGANARVPPVPSAVEVLAWAGA